jgi:hypothetical protein
LNRKRQPIDPLAAMKAANPVSTADLALDPAEVDLVLARVVALGRVPSQPIQVGDRAALKGGRRRMTTLGLSFAVAAVLAALLVVSGWVGGRGEGRTDFAAAAIRVAEANPRLLVTAPGWKVVRADAFEPDSGELTLSDGSHRFEIHWYPARLYRQYLRDRADVSAAQHGALLGMRATTVDYGRGEYATVLSPNGDVFVEVRGRLGSRSAYDEILRSLRPVGVETWLGAMPPSTVRPAARSEAVNRMLRGIPTPPGFDASRLRREGSIANRDSLAVAVGNAVACAWVESWIRARDAGDAAKAARAVDAMASSATWPIVRETEVPWFSNYAVVTKQMQVGRLDWGSAGSEVRADGRTFVYGPAWKLTLGCEGTHRREVGSLPR